MIYFHERLSYEVLSDLPDLEMIVVHIKLPYSRPLLVGVVYRPPDCSTFYDTLLNYLDKLAIDDSDFYLLGDFNCNAAGRGNQFFKRMKDLGLTQLIKQPTRVSPTSSSTIDLIFTNCSHRVSNSGVLDLTISDHYLIYCNRTCRLPRQIPRMIKVRSFKHYDSSQYMKNLQSHAWDSMYTAQTPDNAWNIMKSFLEETTNKLAPSKTMRIRGTQTPWLTREISSLIRSRNKAKKKAVKSKLDSDWTHFKSLRNKVNRLIEKSKRSYYSDLIAQNANDSSNLWATIKKILPTKACASIKELVLDNVTFSRNKDIATAFNTFFTTVGERIKGSVTSCIHSFLSSADDPTSSAETTIKDFQFENISADFVRKALSSLRVKKASGMTIPTRLLKDGAEILAGPLAFIYNLSLKSGSIPTEWKSATVTPIHKGDKTCDPTNYRPISVLPAVMKIFEKAVHRQLYDHLLQNDILSPCQSGFRQHHSTSTALVDLTDFILKNIDNGKFVGAVFLDLKKAFDLVNHHVLLNKLQNIGVREKSLRWFENNLDNRMQSVSVNGSLSDPLPVSLGVPQGSALGPLLFIIFINDLPTNINNSKTVMFADDTAIFYASKDLNEINLKLQEDLTNLSSWFDMNDLIVNTKKTKTMVFGSAKRLSNTSSSTSNCPLSLKQSNLEKTPSMKYLGVTLDPSLNWNDHIDNLCSKISKRLGLLSRLRKFIDTKTSKMIFNTLVLPLFEYCDVVWSNADVTKLERLYRLQKRGARLILKKKIRDERSEVLFSKLNWVPIAERWKFNKCLMVYKCINRLLPEYLRRIFIINSEIHNYNTRAKNNIHIPRINSKSGHRSFAFSAAMLYNSLPDSVKNSETSKKFRVNYWKHFSTDN